jgi:hypothetical protein
VSKITFKSSDAFSTPGNGAGNQLLKNPFSIFVTWLHTHRTSGCVVCTITFVSLPKVAFLIVLFGKEDRYDAKSIFQAAMTMLF